MLNISEETKTAFLTDSTDKQISIEFENFSYDEGNVNYFTGISDGVSSTYKKTDHKSTSHPLQFTYDEEVPIEYTYSNDFVGNYYGGEFSYIPKFKLLAENYTYTYLSNNYTAHKRIYDYDYWYFSFDFRATYNCVNTFSPSRSAWVCGAKFLIVPELHIKYYKAGQLYEETAQAEGIEVIVSQGSNNFGWSINRQNVKFSMPCLLDTVDEDNYLYGFYLKCYLTLSDFEYYEGSGSNPPQTGDLINWTDALTVYSYDNLMFTASDTIPSEYVYPAFKKSIIKNEVYPKEINIPDIKNVDVASETFSVTESLCSDDNLKYGLCESSHCSFDVMNRLDDFKDTYFKAYLTCDNTDKVPLGRFKVTEVKKQTSYNQIKKSITAYDTIGDLEKDATKWYDNYLYFVNIEKVTTNGSTTEVTDSRFTGNDIDFTRQMFSTYYNIASYFDLIDDSEYEFEEEECTDASNDYDYYVRWGDKYSNNNQDYTDYIIFKEFTVSNVNPNKLYKLVCNPINGNGTRITIINTNGNDFNHGNLTGILDRGTVLVIETLNDNSINKFLCDVNNLFAVSPNCVALSIMFMKTPSGRGSGNVLYTPGRVLPIGTVSDVQLYSTDAPDWVLNLPNRSTRLVYYNYNTTKYYRDEEGEDVGTPVECKARDVLRSLFEINGSFVKIGRDGKLQVISAKKHILYPSETLYPADDLYPTERFESSVLSMSKYIKSEQEDYKSAQFGKIQLQSSNSEGASSKIYVGNSNLPSTYIMDDNVFYNNNYVQYLTDTSGNDVLPEINTMLQNMFDKIQYVDFTPHETELVGMPWIETGDRITLITHRDAFESFVFRRTLKGIQALKDTFEAQGEEIIEEISTYD